MKRIANLLSSNITHDKYSLLRNTYSFWRKKIMRIYWREREIIKIAFIDEICQALTTKGKKDSITHVFLY